MVCDWVGWVKGKEKKVQAKRRCLGNKYVGPAMRSLSGKGCRRKSARNWGRGRWFYSHSGQQPQASENGGGCQLTWESVAAHHAILRFTDPLAPSCSAPVANERRLSRDGTDSFFWFGQGHPSETSRAPHDFPAMYRYFVAGLISSSQPVSLQVQFISQPLRYYCYCISFYTEWRPLDAITKNSETRAPFYPQDFHASFNPFQVPVAACILLYP